MARPKVTGKAIGAPGVDLAGLARGLLGQKRDALGFIEGGTPGLSAEQWGWLSIRMSAAGDGEATKRSGIDPETVQSWGADEGFLAVYGLCLTNRREAFKLLGSELLPNALRVIRGLLDKAEMDGDVRAAQLGLTTLLRTQGMYLDRVDPGGAHKMEELLGLLRAPAEITVLEMEARP